jgi:hypothetical protein
MKHVHALLAAVSLAACGGPKATTPDAGPPAWHVVLHDLVPALLCVWGTARDDVFAVGGPRGNGTPASIMHYDGRAWTALSPGGTETYWWAHGTGPRDVWAVGENGRITHWDGVAFREHASGTTATLFGVWAAAPDDVWAAGGTPEGGSHEPNDVLLHYDGTSWTPSPLPQTLGRAFFKVWGVPHGGGYALYLVGELGTIWHRVDGAWRLEANTPPLATGNLTTVSGCSDSEVYAVGGGDVLVSDGETWTRADVELESGVNGVACGSPGDPVIVGFGGLKQRRVAGVWTSDFASEPHADLHGAWADPAGGFWAAGGNFVGTPASGAPRAGVVAYYGTAIPSSSVVETTGRLGE